MKKIIIITSTLLATTAFAKDANQFKNDVCQFDPNFIAQSKSHMAAKIACDEHALWGKPLINSAGHLVQIGPMEGETDKLADGESAWQRVLHYWTAGVGVGYLYAADDIKLDETEAAKNAFIRTRLIDNPWSAAFISYVMKSAGFGESEFALNDGHIRYIKPAYTATLAFERGDAMSYAYTAQNPLNTPMAVGDLLCYAREGRDVYGPKAFFEWLSIHRDDERSLKMHCDIVVSVSRGQARTIGGNVIQAVTMRTLTLTKKGTLSTRHLLPAGMVSDTTLTSAATRATQNEGLCEPMKERGCDMNRKDWVVLLKAR